MLFQFARISPSDRRDSGIFPLQAGFLMLMTKQIKTFFFQNAKYLIADEFGNSIYMVMKYKDNEFELEDYRIVDDNVAKLKEEAELVARKLLAKKHNVNFANRLEV